MRARAHDEIVYSDTHWEEPDFLKARYVSAACFRKRQYLSRVRKEAFSRFAPKSSKRSHEVLMFRFRAAGGPNIA